MTIVTKQSFAYLRAYMFYQDGFLPNAGGWCDQPAKFIEAIEIIEAEMIKLKNDKEKENW